MQKAIELAKKIRKNLDADWTSDIEEINFHSVFGAIYTINTIQIEDKNRLICLIIYAYDPESPWLNLEKDRFDNKLKMIDSLGGDSNLPIYQNFLYIGNEIINMCTFNFLEELKTWEWIAIFNLLDYASKMQRFATEETEAEKSYQKMDKEGAVKTITSEVDIETISKVNKEKGLLLDQSIAKRRQADILLDEIRKKFVGTDHGTQSDFNFNFTDTSLKKDKLSWRNFIKERNLRKSIS